MISVQVYGKVFHVEMNHGQILDCDPSGALIFTVDDVQLFYPPVLEAIIQAYLDGVAEGKKSI